MKANIEPDIQPNIQPNIDCPLPNKCFSLHQKKCLPPQNLHAAAVYSALWYFFLSKIEIMRGKIPPEKMQ